jgi:hypothetical protein
MLGIGRKRPIGTTERKAIIVRTHSPNDAGEATTTVSDQRRVDPLGSEIGVFVENGGRLSDHV